MSIKRHAAIGFVFVTVLLDMLALGIIVPVLPRLILDFLHGDMARTSEAMGLFVTTWALMQFFFSPILGMLSDRYGRRPVILLSNFGLGLDYIVMALAPTMAWLFLGRILSGITASSMPTANAYISDVTPPDKRARAFGIFGAAFGIGFVMGPAVGGWLGAINPRLPFWVAAGFSLANACYGLFVLPESLAPEKRSQKPAGKAPTPSEHSSSSAPTASSLVSPPSTSSAISPTRSTPPSGCSMPRSASTGTKGRSASHSLWSALPP